ncbi:hypothetical protein HYDPIDRAFT_29114 [Hydnomerulius pinastri MD-312]|uniref:Uncharacterized protein n=1 Tax=Hydnomerulius pinastri MD-312 TaxID=994086 RepID=A0A0C9W8G6_9AGAM|nr:hypothetical protein HYDPIDRAFT_29114 [Hydnomerulius pinastri MD-312]
MVLLTIAHLAITKPICKRALLSSINRGSPGIETQDSWYINFRSAHDIRHVASGSVDDLNVRTAATARELAQRLIHCHVPKESKPGVDEDGDEKSIYSQESADPDLHNILLSIPIIPRTQARAQGHRQGAWA